MSDGLSSRRRTRCLWIDDAPERPRAIAADHAFARAVEAHVVADCDVAVEYIGTAFSPDVVVLDVVDATGGDFVAQALETPLAQYPWILISDRARAQALPSKRDVVCMSSHVLREPPALLATAISESMTQLRTGEPPVSRAYLQVVVHHARHALDSARYDILVNGPEPDLARTLDERLDEIADCLNRIVLQ